MNPLAAGRASLPAVYFSKRIDNSRLVREVGLEKCREYFSVLGVGILVFLSVLLYCWQHLQCVRAGYEIEDLKAQRVALQESNRQLLLAHAALTDPQRIDTLARKYLGMVSPSPQQVIPLGGTEAASMPEAESGPPSRYSPTIGDGNREEP
jgi:cell division protein FtsL